MVQDGGHTNKNNMYELSWLSFRCAHCDKSSNAAAKALQTVNEANTVWLLEAPSKKQTQAAFGCTHVGHDCTDAAAKVSCCHQRMRTTIRNAPQCHT